METFSYLLQSKLSLWQIIAMSCIGFLLYDALSKLMKKINRNSDKLSVTTEEWTRYNISKFSMFGKEYQRGMTVRLNMMSSYQEYYVGELIGMSHEQIIMVATPEKTIHVPYESLDDIEILTTTKE